MKQKYNRATIRECIRRLCQVCRYGDEVQDDHGPLWRHQPTKSLGGWYHEANSLRPRSVGGIYPCAAGPLWEYLQELESEGVCVEDG